MGSPTGHYGQVAGCGDLCKDHALAPRMCRRCGHSWRHWLQVAGGRWCRTKQSLESCRSLTSIARSLRETSEAGRFQKALALPLECCRDPPSVNLLTYSHFSVARNIYEGTILLSHPQKTRIAKLFGGFCKLLILNSISRTRASARS